MKSFKKKVTSFILIVLTLALVVPYADFTKVSASSSILDAKKMNAYDFTSSPALAEKLTQVFQGKIGLYSSTKFQNQVKAPLGCSKLTGRNQYFIKGNATGSTNSGWQCYIYANAVYNTLYNEWVGRAGSLKNSKVVISGGSTFSYKQFVKAGVKCGAYARTTGNRNGSYHTSKAHSFVILGYNEETVTYIEGNANGRGLVKVTVSTWKELNNSQTTGRGRYICHVVQPTDKYYASLYESGNKSSGSSKAVKETKTADAASTVSNPDSVKVKFSRTLSYSKSKKVMSGKDVRYMQTCLKFLGYSVTVNSKYDSKTASAVKKFQKANKLTADGKMGSKTFSAIEKAVQAKNDIGKITVKFNANGGSKAPTNQKVEPKKATALTKNVPVRSGYDFMGWSLSKNAEKVEYKSGAKITVEKDTTLYAVWKEQEFKIVTQPKDLKVKPGVKITLKIEATGVGLSYKWYYKKAGETEWTYWPKHDCASSLSKPNASWDGMDYYCVVTNADGETLSSEIAHTTVVK